VFSVTAASKNFDDIVFTLETNAIHLQKQVPVDTYDITADTNLETAKDGAPIPIILGTVKDVVPTCIDTNANQYRACGHASTITEVYDNKDDIHVAVAYTDNGTGRFTTTVTPVGKLTCDVVGSTNNKEGAMLNELFTAAGFLAKYYDNASLANLDVNRPYLQGILIDKKESLEAIILKLNAGTLAYHYFGRDGVLYFDALENPDVSSEEPESSYDRHDFISMNEKMYIQDIKNKVSIGYDRWFSDADKTPYVEAEDTTAQTIYPNATEQKIETYLTSKTDAQTVAGLYMAMFKKRRLSITLRTRAKALENRPGNIIELTKKRFNSDVAARLLITSIEENWETKESVIEAFKLID
jgi:hypothetical protein